MNRLTRCAPLLLLLAFGCVIADNTASVTPSTALPKQLFANTEFEHTYLADARAKALKKFDILASTDECPATFNVAKDYRAARLHVQRATALAAGSDWGGVR